MRKDIDSGAGFPASHCAADPKGGGEFVGFNQAFGPAAPKADVIPPPAAKPAPDAPKEANGPGQ